MQYHIEIHPVNKAKLLCHVVSTKFPRLFLEMHIYQIALHAVSVSGRSCSICQWTFMQYLSVDVHAVSVSGCSCSICQWMFNCSCSIFQCQSKSLAALCMRYASRHNFMCRIVVMWFLWILRHEWWWFIFFNGDKLLATMLLLAD